MQRDPYRGRAYEDDPRALPPQNMVRLIPDTISGCGCSAATAASQGDPDPLNSGSRYRRPAHERARRRIWGADKMFDG